MTFLFSHKKCISVPLILLYNTYLSKKFHSWLPLDSFQNPKPNRNCQSFQSKVLKLLEPFEKENKDCLEFANLKLGFTFYFWDGVSLCSSGCLGNPCVDQGFLSNSQRLTSFCLPNAEIKDKVNQTEYQCVCIIIFIKY